MTLPQRPLSASFNLGLGVRDSQELHVALQWSGTRRVHVSSPSCLVLLACTFKELWSSKGLSYIPIDNFPSGGLLYRWDVYLLVKNSGRERKEGRTPVILLVGPASCSEDPSALHLVPVLLKAQSWTQRAPKQGVHNPVPTAMQLVA